MGEMIEMALKRPEFASLSAQDRDTLAMYLIEETLPAKRLLYREGQMAPGLVMVIEGVVKLERRLQDGRSLIVSLAGPNDLFGMCCQPYDGGRSPCAARTQTECRILTMTVLHWRHLYTNQPIIGRAVVSALLKSRLGCTDMGTRLAFQTVESRLAQLLLQLSRWGYGAGNGKPEIPRVLSQTEMANAIGTAREVVTRSLAMFEQRGILRRGTRKISIDNLAALAALAS